MLTIKNLETSGWAAALRGMRNPMNSWNKADSEKRVCYNLDALDFLGRMHLGPNDLQLCKKLIAGGPSHRKFLRMIHVQMDITAPLYWWKEYDTYKVGTTANSCSTMHKIHSKRFEVEDFSIDHLNNMGALCSSFDTLEHTIRVLNFWRDRYNQTDEEREEYFGMNGYDGVPTQKECWWQMIQLLPSSYNQTRTVDLDYETFMAQYALRRNHKLDEWRAYCEWLRDSLPYMDTFLDAVGMKEENNER